MSSRAMSWALDEAPIPRREPLAHLVLMGLAFHVAPGGTLSRASVATLARYARCSTPAVDQKLVVLEKAGLIGRADPTAAMPGDVEAPIVWDLNIPDGPDSHDVEGAK